MYKMRFWHPQPQPQPNQTMDSNPQPQPQPQFKLTTTPNNNTNPIFFTILHPNLKPNPIFFMEITTTPTTTQFYYPKTPYTQHQPNFFLKYLPQPNPNFQKC